MVVRHAPAEISLVIFHRAEIDGGGEICNGLRVVVGLLIEFAPFKGDGKQVGTCSENFGISLQSFGGLVSTSQLTGDVDLSSEFIGDFQGWACWGFRFNRGRCLSKAKGRENSRNRGQTGNRSVPHQS